MFNFDEASHKSKEAMDTMLKNYSAVTKGFQAIATEAADFSKKSFEDSVAHVEKLAGVKSIEAAVELQTSFVKASFDKMVAEATKIGELYAEVAKTAYAPYQSALNKANVQAPQFNEAA
ncbi:phasin family protein [Rhizobium sp. C4]|uniref:phasin family protein n=1 Tax=Rhizobium sp. C4 TaxID=1349800 RepID=UPI001E371763|nr:phasin family protein [Rhizobium sp. C4]MCD2171474.1 phasin family protein [Rhizobium sp. C4]